MSNAWEDLDLALEVDLKASPSSAPLPGTADVAAYGASTVTVDQGAHLITMDVTAASDAGLTWTLPAPVPGTRQRVTFLWESLDPSGMQADSIRIDLMDDARVMDSTTATASRGQGYGAMQFQQIYLNADASTTAINVYLSGSVSAGQSWRLGGITMDQGLVNILGETNTVKIARESMDASTLTATILDADLDPTQAGPYGDSLGSGSKVVLSALDPERRDFRFPIFTGRLSRSVITWDQKGWDSSDPANWADHPKATRIEITVGDALATLANTPEPRGVATIDDLRYLMGAHPDVEFVIDNLRSVKATGDVTCVNPDASLLDQVLIARDSQGGRAWIDSSGALRANDNSIDYAPDAVLVTGDGNVQDLAQWTLTDCTATTGQTVEGKLCTLLTASGAGAYSLESDPQAAYPERSSSLDVLVHPTAGVTATLTITAYAADDSVADSWTSTTTLEAGSWQALHMDLGGAPIGVASTLSGTLTIDGGDAYVHDFSLWQGVRVLDDRHVSEVQAAYDTDAIVNQVNVTIQVGSGDDAAEVTVGPYSDGASVDTWGPRSTTVTVHAPMTDAERKDPQAYEAIGESVAARLLQPEPMMRVSEAVVPVNDPSRYAEVFRDLETKRFIKVGRVAALGVTERIEHEITPNSWTITYGFRPPEGQPPVLQTSGLTQGNVTGWQPVALESGYAQRPGDVYTPRVRTTGGGAFYLTGQLDTSVGDWEGQNHVVARLPAGYRPNGVEVSLNQWLSDSVNVRSWISTDGYIHVKGMQSGTASGYFQLQATWAT